MACRRLASRRTRRCLWPGLAAGIALAGLGCQGPASDLTAPSFHPTATIQDIMLSMVDPSADVVWNSVATIVSHDGIEDRRPRTEEDWREVRNGAVRLLEATNLLLMEGRAAAAPGVLSENPGLELHPEQIDERIAEDPETWRRLVGGLYTQARIMLDAVEARDADMLFDNGGPLDRACENCHQAYWYPDAIANPPVPGRAPVAPSMRRDAPADAAEGGTIAGHVRLNGELPGNQVIRMGLDPLCRRLNDGRVVVQELVATRRDGSLANVFVQLEGAFPDTAVPDAPVVVDQVDCLYTPRVVGARAGQAVRFRNTDDLLHNVHGASATTNGFNVGQPRAGMVFETELAVEPEGAMLHVTCDRHPWMHAYVGVVDHPYFAVSDAGGAFTIAGVPAGTYRIRFWHEVYGELTQTVTVEAGGTASVDAAYES